MPVLESAPENQVTPTPYHRFPVRDLDAITLHVPTEGYVTVNNPRTLYRSLRGTTIQTDGETQRFTRRDTVVSSVVFQGQTYTNDGDLLIALLGSSIPPAIQDILDKVFGSNDNNDFIREGAHVVVKGHSPDWDHPGTVTLDDRDTSSTVLVRMGAGPHAGLEGIFSPEDIHPAPAPFEVVGGFDYEYEVSDRDHWGNYLFD